MASIPLNIFSAVHVGQRVARLSDAKCLSPENRTTVDKRPMSPSRFLVPIKDGYANQPAPLFTYLAPILKDFQGFKKQYGKGLSESFQDQLPAVEVGTVKLVGQDDIVKNFTGSEKLTGRQ